MCLSPQIICVVASPDGKLLASASMDLSVILWSRAAGEKAFELKGHAKFVYTVAFSPDGESVFSSGEDGDVRVWNVQDGTEKYVIPAAHDGATVRALGFDLVGRLMTVGFNGKMKTWAPFTAGVKPVAEVNAVVKEPQVFTMDVALGHDGGPVVATGSGDGTLKLWALPASAEADPSPRLKFTHAGGHGEGKAVRTVAISKGNVEGLVASAGLGGDIQVWSLADGEPVQVITAHDGDINSLSFSPDGSCLSSASSDYSVRVWNMPEGTLKHKLVGHTGVVVSADIIPGLDGGADELVSAGCDRTVRTWDLATGKQLCAFEGHSSNVSV